MKNNKTTIFLISILAVVILIPLIIVLIMILLLEIIYSINQHILGLITCRTQFPGPLRVLFSLILMTAL